MGFKFTLLFRASNQQESFNRSYSHSQVIRSGTLTCTLHYADPSLVPIIPTSSCPPSFPNHHVPHHLPLPCPAPFLPRWRTSAPVSGLPTRPRLVPDVMWLQHRLRGGLFRGGGESSWRWLRTGEVGGIREHIRISGMVAAGCRNGNKWTKYLYKKARG